MAGDHLCSVWMVATKVLPTPMMTRNGASVSVQFLETSRVSKCSILRHDFGK